MRRSTVIASAVLAALLLVLVISLAVRSGSASADEERRPVPTEKKHPPGKEVGGFGSGNPAGGNSGGSP